MIKQLFIFLLSISCISAQASSAAADVKSKAADKVADQSAQVKHPYQLVAYFVQLFTPKMKKLTRSQLLVWLEHSLPQQLDNLLVHYSLTPLEQYVVIWLVIKQFGADFPLFSRTSFGAAIQQIVDRQPSVQNIGHQRNLAAAILMASEPVYDFVTDKIIREMETRPVSIQLGLAGHLIKDLIPFVQEYAIEKPLGLSIAQIKADPNARNIAAFDSLFNEQSDSWQLGHCMIVDCDGLTPDTPIEALTLKGNPLERLSVAALPDSLTWLDVSDCPLLRFDDTGAQGKKVTKPHLTTLHAKNNGYTEEEMKRIRAIFPNLKHVELGRNAKLSLKNRDARK
jgi:hypothetical protein